VVVNEREKREKERMSNWGWCVMSCRQRQHACVWGLDWVGSVCRR